MTFKSDTDYKLRVKFKCKFIIWNYFINGTIVDFDYLFGKAYALTVKLDNGNYETFNMNGEDYTNCRVLFKEEEIKDVNYLSLVVHSYYKFCDFCNSIF